MPRVEAYGSYAEGGATEAYGYMNSLDWSRVLDYWNGPLEWTSGLLDRPLNQKQETAPIITTKPKTLKTFA